MPLRRRRCYADVVFRRVLRRADMNAIATTLRAARCHAAAADAI